ncbi:piggyBac transposable element-derived protein 4 [Biomphalaria pfeifferi]|uniref:PiggyBac transposable element-derived protein 4 n=1 Tax=Biomphalaria pfeifferi TaxID=112525 RepID=A0AAD8FC44_BIOPF|nr:piggyBac transposable element-derived protein 4 [Biomphalaria pfeifferi]
MNGVTTYELFDKDCGVAYFRATMPQKRFTFLTNCIRFDDKGTRQEKRERDRLAPIRELFDKIVNTSQQLYTPSEYCTVDEQLLAFRGRCPFKMYIPSKPDKYGIKIMMMCDSKNYYMCNAKVYTGKGSTSAGVSATEYYSVQMTTPNHGTNRNCTFDNWFTSINTARKLYDDHAVTMVGTMKKNKAEIPPSFVELRGREKNSAMFAFSGVLTLLSYCPPKRKKKIVMLLSTMHRRGDTTETVRLPDMVQFYNETKCGVDTFDQLCHRYSVSRRTRRWPLTVFYGLLNAVGINSMAHMQMTKKQYQTDVPTSRRWLRLLSNLRWKPVSDIQNFQRTCARSSTVYSRLNQLRGLRHARQVDEQEESAGAHSAIDLRIAKVKQSVAAVTNSYVPAINIRSVQTVQMTDAYSK